MIAVRHTYLSGNSNLSISWQGKIYMVETWLNAHQTFEHVWLVMAKVVYEYHLEKSRRIIILHAGWECGWIPNSDLVFRGKIWS